MVLLPAKKPSKGLVEALESISLQALQALTSPSSPYKPFKPLQALQALQALIDLAGIYRYFFQCIYDRSDGIIYTIQYIQYQVLYTWIILLYNPGGPNINYSIYDRSDGTIIRAILIRGCCRGFGVPHFATLVAKDL